MVHVTILILSDIITVLLGEAVLSIWWAIFVMQNCDGHKYLKKKKKKKVCHESYN